MPRKVKLKVNVYEVVSRAIDAGIEYGYRRAFKHTDTPEGDAIKEQIRQAIMSELCEVVRFEDR